MDSTVDSTFDSTSSTNLNTTEANQTTSYKMMLHSHYSIDSTIDSTMDSNFSTTLNTIDPSQTTGLKLKKDKKRRKKKKRPPHKSKMVTGYIIYASEIRKDIIKQYPERNFGDISKIVGVEWKNLPQETKIAYEKRAQEQNAKFRVAAAEALELKKLADAAEERAREQQLLLQQQQHQEQQQIQFQQQQQLIQLQQQEHVQQIYQEQEQMQVQQQVRKQKPKKPLRYSEKFVEYLNSLSTKLCKPLCNFVE